ncbi:hypothetical protein E3J79_03330 [Candidatus Dependentiae bacterium]|nr:MAG: hypothetical protein E3J79_03330 [Candidatus Dependentiae bacterium]
MKLFWDTKWMRRRVLRFLFVAEIVLFVTFYLFGSNSIQRLLELQSEQKELDMQLQNVKANVSYLNEQIELWNESSFFKEKVAREQLQMAREDDEIYYLDVS